MTATLKMPDSASAPWPPAKCPPWCGYPSGSRAGHKASDHDEDRSHWGAPVQVPLSGEPGRLLGGVSEPEYLTLYVARHEAQDEPSIFVGISEEPGVYLTRREAGNLANALHRAIVTALDPVAETEES